MLARISRTVYGLYAVPTFLGVILPVCALIAVCPTLALRRELARNGVKLACLAIGCPIRVEGLEHLPAGPAICVANHTSYLDGLVLTAALPARYTFLVQDGASSWPLAGSTLRHIGARFVNRGSPREAAAAMKSLIKGAQDGESFTIFAEGTFEAKPGLLAFQSGAFLTAVRAGVPVVPTVIRGTRKMLPDGGRLLRRSTIHIQILPPIAPAGHGREAANTLRDAARTAILARCGEPDAGSKLPAPETESA